MSAACSLFMRRGGSVYCTITERRNYFAISFAIVKGTAKNAKVFHHEQFAIYGIITYRGTYKSAIVTYIVTQTLVK